MEDTVNEENPEEVKVLEAQIQHLQAEIAELQRQQQDNDKEMPVCFRGHMLEALYVVLLLHCRVMRLGLCPCRDI